MEDVVHLSVDDILDIYASIFEISVARAANHLTRREVLESALGRPIQRAHYGGADLIEQAACYGCAIAESQAFVDGNKRTAFIAVQAFLEFNGYTLTCTDDDLAQWILALSAGLSIEDFAENLRPWVI